MLILTRRRAYECAVRHSIGFRMVSPRRLGSRLSPRSLYLRFLAATAFADCPHPWRGLSADAMDSLVLMRLASRLSPTHQPWPFRRSFLLSCHPESRAASCCHSCRMTAVPAPLSPSLGDSGRQGRAVMTSVEGQPHHTPRGPGTRLSTIAAGAPCSSSHDGERMNALSVTPSDFGWSAHAALAPS